MRRLSPGTLLVLVFAILLGLLGAYAVKKYLTREPAPVVAETPKEMVYRMPVAVHDLPAGRVVAEEDVMTLSLTAKDIIKAKYPTTWMDQVKQIAGRTLRQPQKRGQPFEAASFYPKGMGPSLADNLEPGERAVTIPLGKDAVDVAMLTPGAVVDVLFRSDPKGSVPDATVTLLSRVKVLAIGTKTLVGSIPAETKAEAPSTITLAVDQTQARALKVVEGRGSLMIVQRSAKDNQLADKGGPTTLPGLLGLKEPEKPFATEIYRAGRLATMVFQDDRRQSMTLDPPFGMPVQESKKDGKKDTLELWYSNPWGWGGWGGVGYGGGWGGNTGGGETIPGRGGWGRGGYGY